MPPNWNYLSWIKANQPQRVTETAPFNPIIPYSSPIPSSITGGPQEEDISPQSISVTSDMPKLATYNSATPKLHLPFISPVNTATSAPQLPEPPETSDSLIPKIPPAIISSTTHTPTKPFVLPQSTVGLNKQNELPSPPQVGSRILGLSKESLAVIDHLKNFAGPTMAATAHKDFPKAVAHQNPSRPPRAISTSIATSLSSISPLLQPQHVTGNKVVVSIPDKKVVVYDSKGNTLREYSVFVGRSDSPTPRGQFRIMENISPDEKEWYYGGHWLGFAYNYDKPHSGSYAGFHGWTKNDARDRAEGTYTDEELNKMYPRYKNTTEGCVQMKDSDIAEFSQLLGAGDPVSVLDTPLNPPAPKAKSIQMHQISSLPSLLGFGVR